MTSFYTKFLNRIGLKCIPFFLLVLDPTQFKFPSLDPETERFLYRRKTDLELALRGMENNTGEFIYNVYVCLGLYVRE